VPFVTDPVFETERTIVRSWQPDEVDRCFDIYRRWEVAQWLGAEPKALEHRDEAAGAIERWYRRNVDDDPIAGIWAVERKSDGVVAGTVLLVPLSGGDGEYEVGWHFHPDSWGQGYASESARGALGFGWAAGLTEIFAVVRPGNDASTAVCRRIGMSHLGLSSQYYETELELFRIAAPADSSD
jgi:RimJ/RimL family protein N-acetyltransferase